MADICLGLNVLTVQCCLQAVDMQQMTALHLAASHDEKEVVRMLIEQGANLRCVDEDMDTPLHYACMEGSADIVNMLFEAGEKQHGWVTVSQVGTTGKLDRAFRKRFMNENTFCSNFDFNDPIRSQICTCPHSSAVIGCAKLWHDMTSIFHVIATHIFCQIWILRLWTIMKWIPDISVDRLLWAWVVNYIVMHPLIGWAYTQNDLSLS